LKAANTNLWILKPKISMYYQKITRRVVYIIYNLAH
jgi:hypothetical protein